MEGLLDFLQKYSDVDIAFIGNFLEIRQGDHTYAPFSIDLDIVANWLKTEKGKLKKTLIKTYTKNIDYISLSLEDKRNNHKHGGQNKETILLTPDTFYKIGSKAYICNNLVFDIKLNRIIKTTLLTNIKGN